MYELVDSVGSQAVIRIIGIGGCGGNAINYLTSLNILDVEYVYIDIEDEIMALIASRAESKLPIPKVMADALAFKVELDEEIIQYWLDNMVATIDGAHMVILLTGMGGDTGSVIAPALAGLALERGILTVACAVTPFDDEGAYQRVIEKNIDALYQQVDSLLLIHNQRECEYIGGNATAAEVFVQVNDIFKNSIQGLTELITNVGLIGVDFADVRTCLSKAGCVSTSTATAIGRSRARKAVTKALSGSGLEGGKMKSARSVIVSIRSCPDITFSEYTEIGDAVYECLGDDAVTLVGHAFSGWQLAQGEMRVTIFAMELSGEKH